MKNYTETKIDRAWFSRLLQHLGGETEWIYSYNPTARTGQMVVTTIRCAKAPAKWSPPTNQHPSFYAPDTLSATRRKSITFHGLAYTKLNWGSSNLVLTLTEDEDCT